MIETRVTAKSQEAFERKLRKFEGRLRDRTPANRQVSVQMYAWTIRNFDREGALLGGWSPLAPKTVREKSRIGKQKMLVRTGALRNSLVPFYSNDNAGIGSELEYSEYHQKGTDDLPKREMLPTREVVQEIGLKVYNAYVARATREANS
jgi:phage gpG-like protein